MQKLKHMLMCRKMVVGLELLCQAYNSDPGHPGVINLLAHYCLLQGDYEKVHGLGLHLLLMQIESNWFCQQCISGIPFP